MSINQDYPSIDGIAPSWADVQVTATVAGGGALVEMSDIAAIKSGRKLDIGVQKGTSGGRKMKRTQGEGDSDASITLYKSGYRKLLKALMAKAPTRGNQKVIGVVTFDILVQHTPIGETEIYTRKIKGCRVQSDSMESKEGTDADQVEVELNVIDVVDIIDGVEVTLA